MSSLRQLNEPLPVGVGLGSDGRPAWVSRGRGRRRPGGRDRHVGRERVECVLDTWCVDDSWWSERPVRRIYHEVQLEGGVRLVLSWDMVRERWLAQR